MKKILMRGAAALILGGFIVACSHDDIDYTPLVDGKVQAYQETFVDAYGAIDPNQTWGFTTLAAQDLTRAAYPNANMWGTSGVPNSEQPYVVPQPLTSAQKDKVRRWFQQHKNPDGVALHYTDFFVQQVYKGHTELSGANSDCLEEYTAGNGEKVIGSEQTDYLMAGQLSDGTYDHIFDFNNANYSGGAPNQDVWDGTLDPSKGSDFNDQKVYHKDQIMLLRNSSTESFGFHSSQGSVQHHDQYVIIPGDVIQGWDSSTTVNGESSDVSGMWFVGFDYEAKMPTDPYFDNAQTNMFCIQPNSSNSPDAVEIANRDGFKAVIGASDGYYSDWIVRITPGLLRDEITIPIDQGEETEDKITIKTTKLKYKLTQLVEQGRVFCEDLGKISRNDLDFNDVVFDAYVTKTQTYTVIQVTEDDVPLPDETIYDDPTYSTEIVLLAAGGTLPLTLAGSYDVHDVLGHNSYTTIINTIADKENGTYGNVTADPDPDPVPLGTDFTYKSIVEIPIKVQYSDGSTLELKAEQGWAPHKILVPIGTKWCREREDIADAYPDFKSYVGTSAKFWEGRKDDSKLFYHPKDTYTERSMEPVIDYLSTEGPTITYRSKGGTITTGGYQDEEVLSRRNLKFNE